MEVNFIAFGIAKDILRQQHMSIELPEGSSLSDAKRHLETEFPEFSKLSSLRLAVGEEYREDSYELTAGEEVVIIPPVSGG
jgi:molybdopterin converting factor small subunit